MICPTCGGSVENFVTFIRYASGHTGPPSRMLPCHQCDGTGEISDEQSDWIKLGEIMRRERIGRNVGLREEAERRGMRPSTLSKMEQGRMKPMPEPHHATDYLDQAVPLGQTAQEEDQYDDLMKDYENALSEVERLRPEAAAAVRMREAIGKLPKPTEIHGPFAMLPTPVSILESCHESAKPGNGSPILEELEKLRLRVKLMGDTLLAVSAKLGIEDGENKIVAIGKLQEELKLLRSEPKVRRFRARDGFPDKRYVELQGVVMKIIGLDGELRDPPDMWRERWQEFLRDGAWIEQPPGEDWSKPASEPDDEIFTARPPLEVVGRLVSLERAETAERERDEARQEVKRHVQEREYLSQQLADRDAALTTLRAAAEKLLKCWDAQYCSYTNREAAEIASNRWERDCAELLGGLRSAIAPDAGSRRLANLEAAYRCLNYLTESLEKLLGCKSANPESLVEHVTDELERLRKDKENASKVGNGLLQELQAEQARSAKLAKIAGTFRLHHVKFRSTRDHAMDRESNTYLVDKEHVEEFDAAIEALLAEEATAAGKGTMG
jgi:transcriptional regulator with XRE-family HTH domain